MHIFERDDFDRLLQALAGEGYQLIGPTVRDGAIVYDEIAGSRDLPEGWTDEQAAGHYRLKRRADQALFGYVVGPPSWKKFLFPPRESLFTAIRGEGALGFRPAEQDDKKRAFIGVRSCELHAISVQDRVFTAGPYVNSAYRLRRENLFLVAVNCGQAGATCFCASMGTGPAAKSGFDLVLTEILEGGRHYFTVESGSDRGASVVQGIGCPMADPRDRELARKASERAEAQMGRTLDTDGIKDLLYRNLEHPRWAALAERCLSCANCTLVCPTCFCSTVEDVTDLAGRTAERVQRWDSCFNGEFSYLVGGSIRQSTRSRYRQWLTHKLASGHDQFGSSGCVGCGRCITWCPVGIDITEEVRAIRDTDGDR